MTIVQTLSSEMGKVIEYGISIEAYYYWENRYSKDGILGLVNKKTGANCQKTVWI